MVAEIDIIILSYAKTIKLRNLTEQAISTCLSSEKSEDVIFNILVIESNNSTPSYSFERTTTIYPNEKFGFNKFLNIGIQKTSSKYVCLCNNDLIFYKGWATEILKEFTNHPQLLSANPYCENFSYDQRIIDSGHVVFQKGNEHINGILTGWCIFLQRNIFNTIGPLDERFEFWYADNDFNLSLQKHGIEHALIKNSKVTHLACQSHSILGDRLDAMTIGQKTLFEKKWRKSFWKRLRTKFFKK